VEHEAIVLQSQLRVLRAQINGLLARPVETALPPLPERLEDLIMTDGEGARPELAGMDARIDAATQQEALAKRGHAPRLSANASYNSMWAHPAHRLMMGVGVAVPLQGRAIAADRARAEHERRALERDREALQDDISVDVATARERLAEAEHVHELHTTKLIPAAREYVEAARIAYENHEAPLRDLVSAERELRTLELHLHRLDADRLARQADLRFALGQSIDCSAQAGEASDV
jgi:outer membrane protein TolC